MKVFLAKPFKGHRTAQSQIAEMDHSDHSDDGVFAPPVPAAAAATLAGNRPQKKRRTTLVDQAQADGGSSSALKDAFEAGKGASTESDENNCRICGQATQPGQRHEAGRNNEIQFHRRCYNGIRALERMATIKDRKEGRRCTKHADALGKLRKEQPSLWIREVMKVVLDEGTARGRQQKEKAPGIVESVMRFQSLRESRQPNSHRRLFLAPCTYN